MHKVSQQGPSTKDLAMEAIAPTQAHHEEAPQMDDVMQKIADFVLGSGRKTIINADIYEAFPGRKGPIQNILSNMRVLGLIRRVERGVYEIVQDFDAELHRRMREAEEARDSLKSEVFSLRLAFERIQDELNELRSASMRYTQNLQSILSEKRRVEDENKRLREENLNLRGGAVRRKAV